MEFNKQNIRTRATTAETHVIDQGLRAYMLKVYNYMASGVFLTGIISLFLFKLSCSPLIISIIGKKFNSKALSKSSFFAIRSGLRSIYPIQ